MGLPEWFSFMRKKGYDPAVLHRLLLPTILIGTQRVDVLGSFYRVIRDAYSNNPQDKAHSILEQELLKYGSPVTSVLYVDGEQAVEKAATARIREEIRAKAASRCVSSLDIMESRLDKNQRLRKRHFTDVRTNLAPSFYWSLRSRESFVNYMAGRGWNSRLCRTEADVSIAIDYEAGDVVLSGDSDYFGYISIERLWRPVSNGLILDYHVPDVLQQLGLTRSQLTGLAVVSKNDYSRNIYSLGPSTNFSIVKSIKGHGDPREVVAAYLQHQRVILQNTANKTFDMAIRVFVDCEQTPVGAQPSVPSPRVSYDDLRRRFTDLCTRHNEQKQKRQTTGAASSNSKTDIVRLRSSKTPNRFKTVESPALQHSSITHPPPPSSSLEPKPPVSSSGPEPTGHPALKRTRIPRHRQRYSFRQRSRKKTHDSPPNMKQYKLKPYKDLPNTTEEPPSDATNKPATGKRKTPTDSPSTPVAAMSKNELVRSMAWHHPTVTLDVGTLSANTRRVHPHHEDVQQDVVTCIQEVSRLAAETKRKAQRLLGVFIERLGELEDISESDRGLLDLFCARVEPKDIDDCDAGKGDDASEAQDTSDLDDKGNGSKQEQFLACFLTYLYSGNYPRSSVAGKAVARLIGRLSSLGLYAPPRLQSDLNTTMPYTPSFLVRSVATQLSTELKRMYRNGSLELYKKLMALKGKGRLSNEVVFRIRGDVSAIENFVALNKISPSPRKIVSVTKIQQPFISFSERELAAFFWKKPILKERLLELASSDKCTLYTCDDALEWIGTKTPGYLTKAFLCDVDPAGLSDLSSRKRGKLGHRAAVRLLSLDEIRTHLTLLQEPDFDPREYNRKGYMLRGSIRTDGFRIMLIGFKLRELQMVRYRRIAAERLPPRITSTVGGVDYFLKEIRHVFATKEDVMRHFPEVGAGDIKVLTLDAGQAFVVGAYAHLPQDPDTSDKDKVVIRNESSTYATSASPSTATCDSHLGSSSGPAQDTAIISSTGPAKDTIFRNLAVNQKAVYQPIFRHRRWLQSEKAAIPEGQSDSIATLESRVPPIRGQGASVFNYVEELQKVENTLDEFYNGRDHRFKKHSWDAERAKQAEYWAIANRLLGIVGGSVGRHRKETEPVVIAIGLGKFSTKSRLASLDSSFLSFFIKLARSLGYLVVGLNEYFTSKRCPHCEGFVAQVTLRRLYCSHCKVYFHRDTMAAENMYNIVRGYLEDQRRPRYLQPQREDGTYPWEDGEGDGPSTGTATASTVSTSSPTAQPSTRQKRSATASSQGSGRQGKKSKELCLY